MSERRENPLSPEEIGRFRSIVYDYYIRCGRELPWRRTTDPYHIFVSEVMLQQTQVDRVMGKYEEFLYIFPTFGSLAGASLKDVLTLWQGLGYNRRALALVKAAHLVMSLYGGRLPESVEELAGLPGIGKATACSVATFAFGMPTVFIETNIRRVFIDHFFGEGEAVSDKDIAPLVGQTLDRNDPRRWYYALMDYGSMLGKSGGNANRRSAHYRKQTSFKGSDRRIRGAVLRLLLEGAHVPEKVITERAGAEPERVRDILGRMMKEGLVMEEGGAYRIP